MATMPDTRRYVANPVDLRRGTLVQLFFDATERHDKAEALRYRAPDGWRSISHRELLQSVRRAALGLEALDIRRGDRVAILAENRPEWVVADYAALCMGALVVPIYATLPPNQIQYILAHAEARAIFVSTALQLDKILEVWHELPDLEHVFMFEDVAAEDPRVSSLERLTELGAEEERAGAAEEFKKRALIAEPDDVVTVIYTSGTTGLPKGVMLTHNNLYSNTRAVEHVLPVSSHDVALSFLPLSHVFERMVDYFLFSRGVTIAYVSSFDQVAAGMQEVRPTIVASTPRVYEKLYARVMGATGFKRKLVLFAKAAGEKWATARLAGQEPDIGTRLRYLLADRLVFSKLRERIGGRLHYFISGGAPLNPDIARFFYSAGLTVLEGYGLTETSPVTNVNTPKELRIGTVGKPVPGTEILIAEDGEILVRGPQVMKGYFKDPEATKAAIDEEGWFRTGDVGMIDDEGYLRITDRKKQLIVTSGGKNIAPQPIENLVAANPFVAEAVMIGDRRPFPTMLVVPNFEELEAWANANGVRAPDRQSLIGDPRVQQKMENEVFALMNGLARYERPKRIALLEREFSIDRGELTPTLKVRRRVVEEHYAGVIEDLYRGAAGTASLE